MTVADRIKAEEREVTMEFATFQHIKGLIEEGLDANVIAKAFKIPIKKCRMLFRK
jgi:hypothetical protein